MRPRRRALVVVAGALFISLATVSPSLAVTLQQYTSTLSFSSHQAGACRPYSGTAIHIQLTTSSSAGAGTYTISVDRCGIINQQVGLPGTCHYPGFCGFGWNINLGSGNTYRFVFDKANNGVVVSSPSVQMWSTA